MKNIKKWWIYGLIILLVSIATVTCLSALDHNLPFKNLFSEDFAGYTSDEGQILAADMVSSAPVSVSQGDTLWFGPCNVAQYFHLVGLDGSGNAATDIIRSKDLTVAETFGNGKVIYVYTVPAGVAKVVFSVPTSVKDGFVVSKTEVTAINYTAFWNLQNVDPTPYIGQNSYYEVSAGDQLYFGAITKENALNSVLYAADGNPNGTVQEKDLRLVESFGGSFGIYCYTVPEGKDIGYVRVSYDPAYEQYYTCCQVKSGESVSDEEVIDFFLSDFGVVLPLNSTVEALSGKSVLFLGDSITYGARDRANIYACGGWAGRIGYYAGMNVTNNGVSGACITTARVESSSEAHYIYNNLVKMNGTTYDYVIMHGLFNDASEGVAPGTAQGKASFDPQKADVTTYAGALELLFYQARVQNPNAILGFIVNFKTERSVDQAPYVELAISICEDWGIEYLDLYHMPGFSVEFDDGLHPSSAGYDSMYTLVANWMAGLDGEPDSENAPAAAAGVMSYNVYWNLTYAGIDNRPDKVMDLIAENDPDILLLQEVKSDWMDLLKESLSQYSSYGYSHTQGKPVDNMGSDEAAPVFWKTAEYDLVDSGYLLTADNGIVSDYPRCINWVVLKDKETGSKIVVMNVHADPNDQTAREKTNQLIVNALDEIRREHGSAAAIVGGDFNIQPGTNTYYTLVGNGLTDSRYLASDTTESGSYNAWNRPEGQYGFGDYLFVSSGVTADRFAVIADWDSDGTGLHISDHCPIIANIHY